MIDVGMRSTQVLGYDRRITSYPNYKITDASIVNISSEPMRRAMVKLGLTYDTGAEKMKQALEILRAIPAKIKDVSGNPSGRHGPTSRTTQTRRWSSRSTTTSRSRATS